MLASRLATWPKSMVLSELYGRLNLHLVRANVRAIIFPAITRNTFEFVCCFVTCVWLLLHLCSFCNLIIPNNLQSSVYTMAIPLFQIILINTLFNYNHSN